MIYLESIQISNFKGIKDLTCEFEDFTLLAGLNNSGKTTVLQVVYLLTTALSVVSIHDNPFNESQIFRRIGLAKPLASLGIQNVDMLLPYMKQGTNSTIIGLFSQGLKI